MTDNPVSLGQCVEIASSGEYLFEGRVYYQPLSNGTVRFETACVFFDASACTGTSLGVTEAERELTVADGGTWLLVTGTLTSPPNAVSASCSATMRPEIGTLFGFSAFIDGLSLERETRIFADGFESGDTSSWSSAVP